MKSIEELLKKNLTNKTVFVRVDLNLPIKNGKLLDDTRIACILPTINVLLKAGAKIILVSHFGRPKGKFIPSLSIAPIDDILCEYLNKDIIFIPDLTSNSAKEKIDDFPAGTIFLSENIRFFPEEESNNKEFAEKLAKVADYFVNDAFSCSHRSHASIDAITKFLPSYAGFSVLHEVENLQKITNSAKNPYTAIIGGAKISTKITLIKNLMQIVDNILIGGAMANCFLKAMDKNVGKSLIENDYINHAKEILELSKESNCKIHIPEDVILAKDFAVSAANRIGHIDEVKDDEMILDIGVKTLENWAKIIENSNTILWNGPLGAFETEPFDNATINLIRKLAWHTNNNNAYSVLGGGDIVASVNKAGMKGNFSYVSPSGGAFLEYLEGKELPAIKALK